MKKSPAKLLEEVLYERTSLLKQQANAQIALMTAMVGALVEGGQLDPNKFKALVARATVTIYGAEPPPRHFLTITETVASFASHSPRPPTEAGPSRDA